MGLDYKLVLWNKDKKTYDKLIALIMLLYITLFAVITSVFNSETSIETLVIRAFGSLAIVMLHIILIIGPLARINTKFLAALIHSGFSLFQFHALGDENPFYSLFTFNMDYYSLTNFPFQVLGFLAMLILFVMASTSHDFFLANLSARVWKRLHMLVYLAYALIIGHVFLGNFQQETSPFTIGFIMLGFLVVAGLHVFSAFKE